MVRAVVTVLALTAESAPRVDVWGGFDVENYGDALFPRIFELELHRRLPDARLTFHSPFGHEGPLHFNRSWPVEALGERTPERLSELADAADLVVIGGGEIAHVRDDLLGTAYGLEPDPAFRPSAFFLDGLGAAGEARTPVAWHGIGIPFDFDEETAALVRDALERRPYVTVRDEGSLARLRRAGVRSDVEVVPDSVLFLPRLFGVVEVEERVAALRARGLYPDRPPLVVQGTAALAPQAATIAAALERGRGDTPLLLLATGPALGDGLFLDELEARLPGPVQRLPPRAELEDIAAAIHSSAGFVGSSLHGSITAVAYGRPLLMLNPDGRAKLDAAAAELGRPELVLHDLTDLAAQVAALLAVGPGPTRLVGLGRRLDAHFDRIAELAVG